jgi:predicted transcriptional regulator
MKRMQEEEVYDELLESVSTYYKAIGSPKRLKILLALRDEFIDGMKWPALKDITGLSNGALKRHIDVLLGAGLIGKSNSSYRISKSGLGLLTQVDEVTEAMKKILENPEELREIIAH